MIAACPLPPPGSVVAVAALSARWLAESARAAGWQVVALDLFGDADTRAAAREWLPAGDAGAGGLDPARLAAGLARARRRHGALGWIAGPGIDADPRLLDAGGAALPRWGMATGAVLAVRDPRRWFAALAAAGLAHPPVSLQPPADPRGWLFKHAAGSGGRHIRPADEAGGGRCGPEGGTAGPDPGRYWQRRADGTPMSVLALADGRAARIVALNRLHVRALSPREPCVYLGAEGPVDDPALQAEVGQALLRLVPALGLRGLFSADFLAGADRITWLELNPRPSATLALHDATWPGGLLAAHLAALAGRLPGKRPCAASVPADRRQGVRTVVATRDWSVDANLAAVLAADPAVHDRPLPGTRVRAGEPLCSVSVQVALAAGQGLEAALDQAEQRLLTRLQAAQALADAASAAHSRGPEGPVHRSPEPAAA